MDPNTQRLLLGAAGAAGAASKTYIEDVFSSYLYKGNGSTQTINNGIDLAGKGGLVWTKCRNNTFGNFIRDSQRTNTSTTLTTNTADPQSVNNLPCTFQNNGYVLSAGFNGDNGSGNNYVSWTFRKAAKFFDVVTWTGDGDSSKPRVIQHNLGVAPGAIVVKTLSASSDWLVYHRSLGPDKNLRLNTNAAAQINSSFPWQNTAPTSTTFTLDPSDSWTNTFGQTYVAYLFAHDTTADGMIQCGSYTGNGSDNGPQVTLSWEPQWLLVKRADSAAYWFMSDTLRGMGLTDNNYLVANAADAEVSTGFPVWVPTATGFRLAGSYVNVNASGGTYIYIAIRRGPMKTPTSGVSVFNAITRTGTNTNTAVTGVGFTPDLVFSQSRPGGYESQSYDRLRGKPKLLIFSNSPEIATNIGFDSFNMDGLNLTADTYYGINGPSIAYVNWLFRRAPGFFDVVAYAGTGSSQTLNHSLSVPPELIIVKARNATSNWRVGTSFGTTTYATGDLNNNTSWTSGVAYGSNWFSSQPTATSFGATSSISSSSTAYIAYLFASCPGVSKVGSYTGTGTTLQINCGFTNGSRFVLIKRTDAAGDWYVWDTARGIVAANDPYILLNSTAAEVTNTDYIDLYAAGFEISSTAPAAINANGGSYIYLSIS